MLLSALCFTIMNVFVKYLSGFSTYQKVFFRALGSLVFTMGYLLYYKIPMGGNQKKLLVLRGLVGVTSMGLFFASTDYLSIGTAVSLRYTSPIFAATADLTPAKSFSSTATTSVLPPKPAVKPLQRSSNPE